MMYSRFLLPVVLTFCILCTMDRTHLSSTFLYHIIRDLNLYETGTRVDDIMILPGNSSANFLPKLTSVPSPGKFVHNISTRVYSFILVKRRTHN